VVLHDTKDPIFAFERIQAVAAGMPVGTRLVPLTLDSHVPHLHKPDALAPLLLQALQ
jgi:pimeloyl-ACP methyl ester carboxylesterase